MRDLKKFRVLSWLFLAALFFRDILGQQLPPRLDIETVPSGHVIVQWPVGDGLYALEERAAFNQGFLWQPSSQAPLLLTATFKVDLAPTNHTRFFRLSQIVQPDPGVVPEPAGQASVPPPNMAGSFSDSTSFLYSGNNSVQLGVAPGTIAPQRASVVRGRVLKRDGSALPGVHVRVLNHPELGFTYTRTDGMFDLGVNGGPQYTIDFQLRGYCPAQRQIDAPVQDFRCLEDVMLVSADPIATVVNFGTAAPLQVAKSTVNTDKAGSRSATVLFPPGTCASIILPNGSTQDCSGLTIRATEFTVGPNGLKSMPAPLPPSSAYTYCVELSGDEATAAGARTIKFNQFVHVYVDNFLAIPTGALIPNGYYDRDLAAWVPQENGVVIKILDTRGGTAVIDIDGDNVPEKESVLAAAQFTGEELRHLAANYESGKSLWRMPVAHFTATDFNCPVNPNDPGKPLKPGDKGKGNGSDQADGGGTIDLVSQVFEETIPLVGVPMNLHYSSARVPGYRVNAEVTLPLTGDSLFPDLIKVGMDFEVAGNLHEYSYPAKTNLVDIYGWDGFDAYGRFVGGTRDGHFRMFYYYPSVYGGHALLAAGGIGTIGYGPPLFGNYGQFRSTISHNEIGQAVTVSFDRSFTIPDHRRLGLGGWSLTPQHYYDPTAHVLYRGDGTIERPDGENVVSSTKFENQTPNKIAAASDGSLFVAGPGAIYRLSRDGSLFLYTAPNPPFTPEQGIKYASSGGFTSIEGTPTARVWLGQTTCYALAVGPDDSLYYRTAFEILRFTPDGVMQVVLGQSGPLAFGEDGTSARACFTSGSGSGGLAVGPDGTIYYGDTWNLNGKTYDFVRKISPDGRLTTLAGRGGRNPDVFNAYADTQGYGGPAIDCVTTGVSHVGVGPDGSVFFSDNYNVNRITPGGTLTGVLNGRPLTQYGMPGRNDNGLLDHEISEGTPAIMKNPPRGGAYSPAIYHMKIGSDGTVYVGTGQGLDQWFLWKVDASGNLQRVAGKWFAPFDDGLNPRESSVGALVDFTIDKEDAITTITRAPNTFSPYFTRRIGPGLPGFDGPELRLASRDGNELYIFNAGGLHLRTLNTLTGGTNWVFSYNSSNQVTAIRDANGLMTVIERDAAGAPTALVGPYGQRTALNSDPAGFLASATNPNGEQTQLTHTPSGLLTSIKGPRGNSFNMTYDSRGRATRMSNPLGGFTSVEYTDENGGDYATSATTALGDQSMREVKLAPNGSSVVITTQPDGTAETKVLPVSGGIIQTNPNGTTLTVTVGQDPRFPGQTQIPASTVISFPGGLQSSVTTVRSASLNSPGDPLSLSNLLASITVNGQVYTDNYDASSNRLTSTSPEGRQRQFDFDRAGHLARVQVGNDTAITNSYDSSGRLITVTETVQGDARNRRFDYNSRGLIEKITDATGRTVRFAYDGAGRMRQFTLPEGVSAEFEFDSERHMTSVTPPGRMKHQFQYNALGLLSQYTPPIVAGDDSVRFAYDADRNLTNIALPDGQVWNMTRGPGGWPRRLQSGSTEVLYSYSGTTGQLLTVTNNEGEGLIFGYQGSLPVLTRWSGVVTGAVSVEFNSDLQVARHRINDQPVTYTYDRDRLLTRAGDLNITRDSAIGRITSRSAGVVSERYLYDDAGQLTNTTVTVNGNPFSEVGLAYDRLSRLVTRTETLSGVTHRWTFAYDVAGHLVETRRDGNSLAAYTYDNNGNRLTRNSETSSYDAQDRITSHAGVSFSWSQNGYRASRASVGQTTSYSYNLDGNLTSVALPGQQIGYLLDPIGRRIGRSVNGALERGWLYLDQQIVAEIAPDSTVTKRFVYAGHSLGPVLMIAGTNSYFLLADERGSIRRVVNTNDGSVAQEIDYDEFGRVLADTNPGFQPFGFSGGIYDSITGLVRIGARDYDAETGQWLARDPIGFGGGQFSLYSYVRNDPINFIDPTGTGPFLGFLARNRQAAIDAAFDTSPGNNDRFANALDRYDRSVQAAVLTGQALVTTGALINSVVPGPRGPASGLASAETGAGRSAALAGARVGASDAASAARAPIGRIMAPRAASFGPGLPGGPAPLAFSEPASFVDGFSPQTVEAVREFFQDNFGYVIFR